MLLRSPHTLFHILPTLCFCFMKEHNSFILLCTSLFWPPTLIAFLALSYHAIVVVRLFLRQFITSQPERSTYTRSHSVSERALAPTLPKKPANFRLCLDVDVDETFRQLRNRRIKNMIFDVFFLVERDCDSARIIIIYQKIQKSYLMYLFIIRREWRGRGGPLSRAVIIFASKMIGSLSLDYVESVLEHYNFFKFSIKIITFVIRNSLKRETWGN